MLSDAPSIANSLLPCRNQNSFARINIGCISARSFSWIMTQCVVQEGWSDARASTPLCDPVSGRHSRIGSRMHPCTHAAAHALLFNSLCRRCLHAACRSRPPVSVTNARPSTPHLQATQRSTVTGHMHASHARPAAACFYPAAHAAPPPFCCSIHSAATLSLIHI